MNYNKIKLKKFKFENQNIQHDTIVNLLKSCYLNKAFSTFPYINNELNSQESINSFNSGNCIGLSIYVKEYLMNNYNIKSYLIPCSIPKKYNKKNYLYLSHVVLACPFTKDECYIIDCAFYFNEPLIFNKKKELNLNIKTSNIYDGSIDILESKNFKTNEKKIFNKYQYIPSNTYYVECNYNNDKYDTWCYYLIEILNPDKAITNFFINSRSDPFITTTILNNDKCLLQCYIKFIDSSNVKISLFHKDIFNGNPQNIPKNLELFLNNILVRFFKQNVKDLLVNISKKENKLYDYND